MTANHLRIAQIAPLAERVPPRKYGGTERVVAALTNDLVRRGHHVTLFASGDSETLAQLEPTIPTALRLMPGIQMPRDHFPALIAQLGQVFAHADAFDIIHNHNDYFAFPLARSSQTPMLTTLHGRLDLPTLPLVFDAFPDAPVNSISLHQRHALLQANWVGNVYNGIDMTHFKLGDGSGGYFAFLGRITPEKGITEAIEIAKRTGIPLKIAAKVDDDHPEYFDLVKDHIDGHLIEWVGEIGEEEKSAFLGNAQALLFPIQWPEPFGLVMAEAMACGTPVLATPYGSVPEIVVDGVSGFVRDGVDGLVEAAGRLEDIDRHRCRAHAETHFSATSMVTSYERIYRRLIADRARVMNLAPISFDTGFIRDALPIAGD